MRTIGKNTYKNTKLLKTKWSSPLKIHLYFLLYKKGKIPFEAKKGEKVYVIFLLEHRKENQVSAEM